MTCPASKGRKTFQKRSMYFCNKGITVNFGTYVYQTVTCILQQVYLRYGRKVLTNSSFSFYRIRLTAKGLCYAVTTNCNAHTWTVDGWRRSTGSRQNEVWAYPLPSSHNHSPVQLINHSCPHLLGMSYPNKGKNDENLFSNFRRWSLLNKDSK